MGNILKLYPHERQAAAAPAARSHGNAFWRSKIASPHFQMSGGASQCYSVLQWIQSDAATWRLTLGVFIPLAMTANAQCEWTVPEDTVPTNVYTSSTQEHTRAQPAWM